MLISYLVTKMVFMCCEFHSDKFVGEISLDFKIDKTSAIIFISTKFSVLINFSTNF